MRVTAASNQQAKGDRWPSISGNGSANNRDFLSPVLSPEALAEGEAPAHVSVTSTRQAKGDRRDCPQQRHYRKNRAVFIPRSTNACHCRFESASEGGSLESPPTPLFLRKTEPFPSLLLHLRRIQAACHHLLNGTSSPQNNPPSTSILCYDYVAGSV